jgi:hypothetical protein
VKAMAKKLAEKTFVIDWLIEGSIEVKAASKEEAQVIFDQKFGSPSFLNPLRDGEITNAAPYEKKRD